MCFSKKILYQYFVVFCPASDNFSTPEPLNNESVITDILFINFLKFFLGCGLSFEADSKNVREKATECSLKTTRGSTGY